MSDAKSSSTTTPVTGAALSPTYALRRKLPDNAFGKSLFSLGMSVRVPYFGTILPYVDEMRPGYCKVTAPKWFGVYNHIHTFHAIAACNLAEVAMGMLMEATTPTTHRWIPKGMTADYLTKATTRLSAVATLAEPVDFAAIESGRDVVVSISITDTRGVEVVHCEITTWVTPTA